MRVLAPGEAASDAQAFTATSPLVSGASVRITSAASMSLSILGSPWSGPSSVTTPFRRLRKVTSCSVFHAMPLPPLPSLDMSGPSDVKRL
jgi:hypothetical protein